MKWKERKKGKKNVTKYELVYEVHKRFIKHIIRSSFVASFADVVKYLLRHFITGHTSTR